MALSRSQRVALHVFLLVIVVLISIWFDTGAHVHSAFIVDRHVS